MVITNIEPQKKHKGRQSVFLDGSFAFGLSDFDLHRLHLKVGMELTEESLSSIRQDVLLQDMKQQALSLLDRHSYTEAAMRRKLLERGGEEESVNETIAFLKSYRYIDDEGYARRYMTAALSAGKSGMIKIKHDLSAKGIARDIIDVVASEFDDEASAETELEAIRQLLTKKLKGDFSFPSKMKAKRYLLSRGFSSSLIDSVLKKLGQEEFDF